MACRETTHSVSRAQYCISADRDKPGKPSFVKAESDTITLAWEAPKDRAVDYYEIKMKPCKEQKWSRRVIQTDDGQACFQVKGLLQETQYLFKVRPQFQDEEEGEFSEESEPMETRSSPALSILKKCTELQDGQPKLYKLPLWERLDARNDRLKTRNCQFGSMGPAIQQQKTIMMIGATGSGKSTLIDGLVNHLLDVKWEDDFRFKIIDLTPDEQNRQQKQTESQTDWITNYKIIPFGNTYNFILNIIDTPGFGDTRGIERDNAVFAQIKHLFTTNGITGIDTLEAVCFVTQAPLMRLTQTQTYIYNSILSIFGKDMKDNIIAMATFADGKEPPVLAALSEAEVPVSRSFVFNNSALFESNKGESMKFSKMFWDMGRESYCEFLKYLPKMKTRSLLLTAEILIKREQLQTTVEGLLPQIDEGLVNLNTIRQEMDLVDKYEREICDNKNFTYKAKEFKHTLVRLEPGEYVTNCITCNITCHKSCGIPNDADKAGCASMSNGYCTVCPGKCHWNLHKNNEYRIEIHEVEVEKTYENMKKTYEVAEQQKVTKETIVQKMKSKFFQLRDRIAGMLQKVLEQGNFLRENAIKSDPLTEIEYIDLLIQTETEEKKPGYNERLNMLRMFKRYAEVKLKSQRSDDVWKLLGDFGLKEM